MNEVSTSRVAVGIATAASVAWNVVFLLMTTFSRPRELVISHGPGGVCERNSILLPQLGSWSLAPACKFTATRLYYNSCEWKHHLRFVLLYFYFSVSLFQIQICRRFKFCVSLYNALAIYSVSSLVYFVILYYFLLQWRVLCIYIWVCIPLCG